MGQAEDWFFEQVGFSTEGSVDTLIETSEQREARRARLAARFHEDTPATIETLLDDGWDA